MKLRGSLTAALLLATHASGQMLLRDVRPGVAADNPGSSPQQPVAAGSLVFFSANDGRLGTELWCSDGTASGTRLVTDLRPGPLGSSPLGLCAWGNRVLFSADDGTAGAEPWISDGTGPGTRLVADLVPGPDGKTPLFVAAGSAFYMITQAVEANGTRVWRSDGTAAGTTYAGAFPYTDLGPPATAVLNGRLLLMVANELWSTDGVQSVRLCTLGSGLRLRLLLATVGSRAYFEASDPTLGNELWSTDGTVAGTGLFYDLTTGAADTHFLAGRVVGANLFLAVDDGQGTSALLKTDGTAAGTSVLHTFATVASSDVPLPLGEVNGKLLFRGYDATNGSEPWVSDGTVPGTHLVLDVAPGIMSSEVSAFLGTRADGAALFVADDRMHGQEPWRTDGTAQGTSLVLDVEPGPAGCDAYSGAVLGNRIFFAPRTKALGAEPWISDGSAPGTRLLADLRQAPMQGCDAGGFAELNGKLYFVADNGVNGREPWESDGTAAGTHMVVDSMPGAASPGLTGFTRVADALVSFATVGTNHALLIAWDGQPFGFRVVTDPASGFAVGIPGAVLATGNTCYFGYTAAVPRAGSLWRTDGTAAGTTRLWLDSGDLAPLASLGPTLFFSRSAGGPQVELWAGDGTPGASVRLATFGASPVLPAVTSCIEHQGRLWFFGYDGTRYDLWASDGTPGGTLMVTGASIGSLGPGYGPGQKAPLLASFSGSLWFGSRLAAGKSRLWRSDGTAAGTVGIHDFQDLTNPMFAVLPECLLFAASEPSTGREPWRTDGTASGTVPLPELAPGPIGGLELTESLVVLGGSSRALFAAHDGKQGVELWSSDGETVTQHGDLAPGPAGSEPSDFMRAGTLVFFVADDGATGKEPFVIGMRELGASFADGLGDGCPGTGGIPSRLSARGTPRLGNAQFAIALSGARALAPAVFLFGPSRSRVLLEGGCPVYVGTPILSLGMSVDANGTALLPLPVPVASTVLGLDVGVQCVVADPFGAYAGLAAFSSGLRLFVGG